VVKLDFSSSVETRRETTPATIALCLRQRGAMKKKGSESSTAEKRRKEKRRRKEEETRGEEKRRRKEEEKRGEGKRRRKEEKKRGEEKRRRTGRRRKEEKERGGGKGACGRVERCPPRTGAVFLQREYPPPSHTHTRWPPCSLAPVTALVTVQQRLFLSVSTRGQQGAKREVLP
jgi:hypothetical protein